MAESNRKWDLYLRLMRLDKPVGIWLLFWPCAFGMALAGTGYISPQLVLLFALGAVAMRAAGCIVNDLIDRDLDALVERTRDRPLASGAVSPAEALLLVCLLCLIGLGVLSQLHPATWWLAPVAVAMAAIYPFMKRITWWPQAFLGLTFNLGALFGWIAVRGTVDLPAFLLYLACLCWTIGYDTIYALQDTRDDARIGIKSTALRFGQANRPAIAAFYALFLGLLLTAGLAAGTGLIYYAGLALVAAHLAWQVLTLQPDRPANCLTRFRANSWLGAGLFVAIALDRALF